MTSTLFKFVLSSKLFMPLEKSCGIVLFRYDAGKKLYLLLHYPGGHWDFPKGHVEAGEGEHQAAIRELHEETGIESAIFVEGFRERVEYFYYRDGKKMHKEVFYFLAESSVSQVRLSFEHKGFEWLPFEVAIERITFKNSKDVLKKAHSTL